MVKKIPEVKTKIESELSCLFGHCKDEIQLMTKMTVGQLPEKIRLMKEFKEGKLNKKDYMNKLINLEKTMYISDDFKKMGKCALKDCGSFMKIKLDNILIKLKKSKMIKDIYTINDYTKIHWLERKNMLETELKEKLK
jgi:hypothetical protein